MIVAVHQPQYIPWLGYFHKIAACDKFVFLDNVQYKQREFQNRNRIRVDKGWAWLTVPVITSEGSRIKMSEVAIDNTMPWQRKHLGSIKTAYSSSAYFNVHFPFFEDVFLRRWDKLAVLNVHIVRYILAYLSIDTPICFESELDVRTTRTVRIIDICKRLGASAYLSGVGAKTYLDESLFQASDIELKYQEFHHPEYKQCFEPFMPYMSIIDLLFNEGPRAKEILLL